MVQRVTEDFVRHYNLLIEKTGNSPHGVSRALDRDGNIAASIRELYRIWTLVERHRLHSKLRFLVQTHGSFPTALDDYERRWRDAVVDLWDWESVKAGQEPLSIMLEGELSDLVPTSPSSEISDDEDWDFDPERHSAADHFQIVANYIAGKAIDAPVFSRANSAFAWLTNTMNLDVGAMERRWREFPVIPVPKKISDAHGIKDPQSLYGYLDNVRLAYIAGATLAAISMCRASTEILIRVHYNKNDYNTKLTPLIKQTQNKREFSFMKNFNILAKIEEANNILHFNKEDIRNVDRQTALIREWVVVIKELIGRAR
jgi:hypothetical protein